MPRTTVGGRRATSERLAAQEFHLVLVNTVAAGTACRLTFRCMVTRNSLSTLGLKVRVYVRLEK